MGFTLKVLGCDGGLGPGSRMSSYLVGGRLLVDAGHLACAGLSGVESLLLTHAHLDHVLHLPFFLTSRWTQGRATLEVAAEADALVRVREGLMGDQVYPDHGMVDRGALGPVARYRELAGTAPCRVAGYEVVPVRLEHPLPCLAYGIRDGRGAGAIVGGDTSDSAGVWELAREPWVKVVTVEVSFPDAERALALKAGHLTPGMLAEQMEARPPRPGLRVLVVHVKPEARGQVRAELAERLGDRVELARAGMVVEVV